MCPRARELYAMATSSEASLAIFAAYAVVSLSHFSTNLLDDLDELEMAELRFKQLLRRLQAAYMYPYPGEFFLFFTGFSQRDGRADNHHQGLWYAQAISPSRSKNIRVQA
mmetsp:Transcript_21628/g.48702  ORF Transcript_21628/g.48702 Transcript_21628/m.48702 type:complete len:110 (-) Transcript_21628:259-588(-)